MYPTTKGTKCAESRQTNGVVCGKTRLGGRRSKRFLTTLERSLALKYKIINKYVYKLYIGPIALSLTFFYIPCDGDVHPHTISRK